MEVILIDDVFELGRRGQIVRVADGYGRNYLLPKRLAIPATAGNKKMIEQQRLAMTKREARSKEEAQVVADELNQLHLLVSRKSGETGTLFGSVTSKDIADLLEKSGIGIDRRKILLHQPIKNIGNFKIPVRPHSEVAAELLLSVLVEGKERVTEAKKRDEESERIIGELDEKIQEIQQLTGTEPSVQEERQPKVEETKVEETEVPQSEEQSQEPQPSE